MQTCMLCTVNFPPMPLPVIEFATPLETLPHFNMLIQRLTRQNQAAYCRYVSGFHAYKDSCKSYQKYKILNLHTFRKSHTYRNT